MAIDVGLVRSETPSASGVLHFNNAGAALQPEAVVESVVGHLRRESQIGGYEAAAEAATALSRTYDAIATMLGCTAEEIALVENATRAWTSVFYAFDFRPGDRILTGRAEYASNALAYLQVARRTGVRIDVVPDDESGQLDVRVLENMLDARVRLISLTHVPTNGGLVNPAAEVGMIARAANVPFLLDACQSAGQMPLDVRELRCDMLSATGRKYLRGPRGTGFLYVRREWIERLEPPVIDLHSASWTGRDAFTIRSDARRFEVWESFVAGRVGLGVAVDYALRLGLADIEERVTLLAARLRTELAGIPGIVVRDKGRRKCGIVTFDRRGESAVHLHERLSAQAINTSVTVREGTRYDMDERNLDSLVRASVHYYNTNDEIDRFCEAVAAPA